MQNITSDLQLSKIKKNKGKTISVTERLTKKGMETLKKAKEDHGFENVWSIEGKTL